ncbi:hypothetical protein INR49_030228 [Caranx melampygus]|nr:hypothetical protein INR49_030228 [Caranx melampygus]
MKRSYPSGAEKKKQGNEKEEKRRMTVLGVGKMNWLTLRRNQDKMKQVPLSSLVNSLTSAHSSEENAKGFDVKSQKSAVCIHSAQFGGQVVLRPTSDQRDLDWCWGWSRDGANGCWQSVSLHFTLLDISVQGQQLDLFLWLSLPRSWDGAGPQPLNAKWQISCAGGFPPWQCWPRLQAPPEVLLLGGTHALEFSGQSVGLVLCMIRAVG